MRRATPRNRRPSVTEVMTKTRLLTIQRALDVLAPVTRTFAAPATVAALVLAMAAFFTTIGADSRWLAALGRVIVARGAIPHGVPFAAAASTHWPNVPVLAELAFHGLEAAIGDRGLMIAQLVAVAVALAVLARDAAAAGAGPGTLSLVMLAVGIGALPSLAIARVQLFSLALFPLLLALLRAEARRPTRRIWLVLPLLALWSNLHGAALVGLAVTLAYLVLDRLRREPRTAVSVALLAPLALCLTPALERTPAYYHGVLANIAAQRGVGLWAPLSPRRPFDVLFVLVACALLVQLRKRRPAAWETVAILALAALTVRTGRSGVWLLFFLLAPAAVTRALPAPRTRLLPVVAALSLAIAAFAIARGPVSTGAGRNLVDRAVALAGRGPVLAEDSLAEQVALAGGRVWVGNPIDAFSHREQGVYLDWLAGKPGGRLALEEPVEIVLVRRGDAAERLVARAPGFARVAADGNAVLYRRAG
jgi:hypothetical protein